MKFGELLTKLNAYSEVIEGLNDQDIFDIRIEATGKLKITLEESKLEIPIT